MVKATVKVGGDTYTSGFKSNYAYKDAKRVWCYTTADALTEGQIALFDQNRAIVKDAAGVKAASSLYIGVCEGKEDRCV